MDPSNAEGMCTDIAGGHAPTGSEEGVHAGSSSDAACGCENRVTEQHGFKFCEINGSSYKYGLAGQYQFTALLDHSITIGFKTKIELAYAKTWNIGNYCNEIVAAKWEIMRPLKEEKIFGKKKDDLTKASWRWDAVKGHWKNKTNSKEQEKQTEQALINKTLTERAGAKLEETITKHEQTVDKIKENINATNLKICKELRVKKEKFEERIKEMDLTVNQLDRTCKEFERKTGDMQAVVDSALEIKCANKGSKGQFVKMVASVQKFMCSVVKLGE